MYLYKYKKICAYICIYIQIGPTLIIINRFSTHHPSDTTAIPMSFASTTWRKRAINRSKKAADCNSLGNGVDISWPWLDRWKPKIVAIRRIHMLIADLLKQIVCVCHIYGISYTILHHHELLAWSFKPIISNKFPIGISFSCKARLPQGHNHPRCPSQHPSSVRGAALVAQRHKWIVSISPFYHNDQLHWVLHA